MNEQPNHEAAPAVDMSRFARLDGLDGLFAVAVCVNPDGEESYWLLSASGDRDGDHGCNCVQCAPHERLGPYVIGTPTKVEPT